MRTQFTSTTILQKLEAGETLSAADAEFLFIVARRDVPDISYETMFGMSKADIIAAGNFQVPPDSRLRIEATCRLSLRLGLKITTGDLATLQSLDIKYPPEKLAALTREDISSIIKIAEDKIIGEVPNSIILDRPISYDTLCKLERIARRYTYCEGDALFDLIGISRDTAATAGSITIPRNRAASRNIKDLCHRITNARDAGTQMNYLTREASLS
ncbi:MAG: hypothetical protein IT558_04430 [Alphaproteobacteria bacterium]|nr:hypothetical protein [Alphaproteobacteria bacterium]